MLDVYLYNTGFEQSQDNAALCQLGAATTIIWDRLPTAIEEELLAVAEKITGVPCTPNAASHIKGLVKRNAKRS